MDELQPDITFDDSVAEDQQPEHQAEPEGQNTGSASATDNTDNDRAVEFTPEQQEKFNREIGKKVAKMREIERENQRLLREKQELEQRLPKQTRPVVPDVPDPYALTDEQFRAQIRQREEILRQQATYDAQQQILLQQQQAEQRRIENERIVALESDAEMYRTRALKVGVNSDELATAGMAVNQFGIDNSLAEMILKDEDGPLITLYLSKNLIELEALSRMTTLQAAVKLVTDIKQKAATLKRKVNTTPSPIDAPRNSGVGSRNYGADGATYE